MASDQPLMTIAEAARHFECSQSTVRRWIKHGRIGYVRLPGGRLRLHRTNVEEIMRGSAKAAS